MLLSLFVSWSDAAAMVTKKIRLLERWTELTSLFASGTRASRATSVERKESGCYSLKRSCLIWQRRFFPALEPRPLAGVSHTRAKNRKKPTNAIWTIARTLQVTSWVRWSFGLVGRKCCPL
ncbi:hypothetical protein L210DRAFT_2204191 [Boletus edulis BED1]|uniref:Uncharacterized protein n=1 Tax=Boletus edulis BED1 TaxID=1328754 RepID=A0AAD4BDR6_BOLED|nr:hypothetical protein L210DRAFT_2204191 [Boletus edulis BED1]